MRAQEEKAMTDQLVVPKEGQQAEKSDFAIENGGITAYNDRRKKKYAIVAPYTNTELTNGNENELIAKTYNPMENSANYISKKLGIEVPNISINRGGYTFSSGDRAGQHTKELSYTFEFNGGATDDIVRFTTLMGDIAFEQQEAVIVKEYVKNRDDGDAFEINIGFKNISYEAVEDILASVGIGDYTINKKFNTIELLDFSSQLDQTAMDKFNKIKNILGGSYNGGTSSFDAIRSSYLDGETRTGIYRSWLKEGQQSRNFGDILWDAKGRAERLAQTGEITNNPIKTDETAVNNDGFSNAENSETHPNTVGAMESDPTSYSYMQNNYGTHMPGENPTRVVDVPLSTDGTDKVSRGAQNIEEGGATPDVMIGYYDEAVRTGKFSYDVVTDEKSLNYAKDTVTENGFKQSVAIFKNAVKANHGALTKEQLTLGFVLLATAQKSVTKGVKGARDVSIELASDCALAGTIAGQTVQGMRIYKQLGPDVVKQYYDKLLEHVNNSEFVKTHLKKGVTELTLPENLNERIETLDSEYQKAKTPEEKKAVEEKLEQFESEVIGELSSQLRGKFSEKFDKIRYFSMLANPRTHFRNITGNILSAVVFDVKDVVKVGVENALAKKLGADRTVSFKKTSKDVRDFAKETANDEKAYLTSTGKYNPETEVLRDRELFSTKIGKAFEKLCDLNGVLLEGEDWVFLKNRYIKVLGDFMTANGYTSFTSNDKIARAKEYAAEEAWKATFRQNSKLATVIKDAGDKNFVAHVLTEGVLPFKKTPINIAKTGLLYSPLGFISVVNDYYGITKDSDGIKKGKVLHDYDMKVRAANNFINDLSASITGTTLYGLGFALASLGLLTGDNKDKEEKELKDINGSGQRYSLKFGDTYASLEWASPMAIPLFMGVETFNSFNQYGKGEKPTLNDIGSRLFNLFTKSLGPFAEMSMIQNLEDLLSGNKYDDTTDAISSTVVGLCIDYFTQVIPSIFSATAKTVDPVQRNIYYTDKTEFIDRQMDLTKNKVLSKIPWASKSIPEKVDIWGETVDSGELWERILENFVLPGYFETIEQDETEKMLQDLYYNGGGSAVLPKKASKTITVDGEDRRLNGEQYAQYQRELGSRNKEMLEQLIAEDKFGKMSNEQKATAISDIYGYSNAKAKKEVMPDYVDKNSWHDRFEKAQKEGVGASDYLFMKQICKDDKNSNKDFADYLNEQSGLDDKDKWALLKNFAPENRKLDQYDILDDDTTKMLYFTEIATQKADDGQDKNADIKKIAEKTGEHEMIVRAQYNIADRVKGSWGSLSEKQKPKAEKLLKAGWSEEKILKACSAVTSLDTRYYIKVLTYLGFSEEDAKKFKKYYA